MPTSYELYELRHTKYKNLSTDYQVAQRMAVDDFKGMSVNGLRGSLSKANTLENKAVFSAELAKNPNTDTSIDRQQAVITKSWEDFEEKKNRIIPYVRESVGVFISDKHNPNYRRDAWLLTIKILASMRDVDYISVQNDWNDLHGWGRWEDRRSSRQKLYDSDIANVRALEQHDMETLRDACPDALLVAIMGNHDQWLYRTYRTHLMQGGESVIADYMEWLYSIGVLQFTDGHYQNHLRLSPNLVWVHGKWTAQYASTNCRNALRQFAQDGRVSNVCFGHSHRGSVMEGRDVGLTSAVAVNNPSLCRNEDVEYMPFGTAFDWNLGFTVWYFKHDSRWARYEKVNFIEWDGRLVAYLNGNRFEVDIDK